MNDEDDQKAEDPTSLVVAEKLRNSIKLEYYYNGSKYRKNKGTATLFFVLNTYYHHLPM